MPRGIYKRKKKRIKKEIDKKIPVLPVYNQYSSQVSAPNYEELYRNLKKDISNQRHQILNELMKSIATINDAMAHVIGELGGGRL